MAVWKSKFYDAFVLNLRVDLHAIDAIEAPDARVVFHTGDDVENQNVLVEHLEPREAAASYNTRE